MMGISTRERAPGAGGAARTSRAVPTLRTAGTLHLLHAAPRALLALGGCATMSESNQQVLMVRTIQDNREVAGAGCVLTNAAGRWFVTSPGRVTVHRSAGNLFVDCKKQGVSAGQDIIASKANNSAILGNAVLTAGLGYLLDRRTGAGFDYPETLTVLMRRPGPDVSQDGAPAAGTPVY